MFHFFKKGDEKTKIKRATTFLGGSNKRISHFLLNFSKCYAEWRERKIGDGNDEMVMKVKYVYGTYLVYYSQY